MIKVLMIGAGRNVKGGVSTVVNQYYEAGLDKKIDLKYISTMQDGNKVKKLVTAVKSYAEFSSVIKDYDILHVHMSHRASFYRKAHFIRKAQKLGKKIIIHMHGSEFDVFYERECNETQKAEIKEIFDMADAVIALSEEWKEKLSVFCEPSKITVLYNAVKMPEFKRQSWNDHNVLFLGRLGKRKGSYDLLETVPDVLKKVPDAKFYLGGDGDVEQIKKIIEEQGLGNSVKYIGWVRSEAKDTMLRKCSTFILPSYHEGMPMAILEAMSYGNVVISTYVGGIPKAITDGVNGYLTKAGDVEKMKEVLVKALTGDAKEVVGRNAFETADNKFNIDKEIGKLMMIYKCVTEGTKITDETEQSTTCSDETNHKTPHVVNIVGGGTTS